MSFCSLFSKKHNTNIVCGKKKKSILFTMFTKLAVNIQQIKSKRKKTKTKYKHHFSLISQLQIESKYKISTASINNIYRTNKKG